MHVVQSEDHCPREPKTIGYGRDTKPDLVVPLSYPIIHEAANNKQPHFQIISQFASQNSQQTWTME